MITVNTTFVIDDMLQPNVLQWIRTDYLPAAAAAGAEMPSLHRVMAEGHTSEGTSSYALHLRWDSLASARGWTEGEGGHMLQQLAACWRGRVMPFTTMLEHIEL